MTPLLALVGLANAQAQAGTTVAVVISSDSAPYEQAARSFEAELHSRRPSATITRHTLQDVDSLASHDLAYAVGSKATAALEPIDVPVVTSMVIEAQPHERRAAWLLDYSVSAELDLIQRAVPRARRVGVLVSPEHQEWVDEARAAADTRGLTLVVAPVASPSRLPSALKSLANRIDVLWAQPDDVVYTPATAKSILLFSFRNRIAFVGLSETWLAAGALLAPVWDPGDAGRSSARLADEVLGGRPISELGIQRPADVKFGVNARTAGQIGLELDPSLLSEATRVVH